MQNIALAFSFLMMMSSCTKTQVVTADLSEKTISDLSYGNDYKQKLDLYLPANRSRSSTKLIILIHGGGWSGGDKAELNSSVNELKKRLPDYAFANLNYRLYNNSTNKFPAQENDIKSAIQFLLSRTQEYNFSNQIVLIGASAGAHLALLQAYKHAGVVRPKAVISFFGPVDLVHLYNNPVNAGIPYLLNSLTGATPAQNADTYLQSSPLYFVNGQSPPTLIFHGDNDQLVPKIQSELLNTKLQTVKVPHRFIVYPGEGHGWTGVNLTHSFDQIANFLKENAD